MYSHSKIEVILEKVISILVFILALVTIFYTIFFPKIVLKGGESITINYKEEYKEPGYEARAIGKDLTKNVLVTGKVNSNKLGTYNLTYKVRNNGLTGKNVRRVKVADLEKPKIILNGSKDTYVCPGATYKDEGVVAKDNYDGDITKKVEVRTDEDIITYTSVDKAGNSSTIKRKLIYKDVNPPEIKADKEVVLTVGDSYNNSYKAFDNCDGEITKNVKVEGTVDSSKTGTYTIKYTIKDKAGNESVQEQKVSVLEKDAPGTIYLTFDDGPQMGTTNVILDILKEEGVKATFFITNKGDDSLVKREFDEGHTVAIHTASHDYSIVYKSVDSYWNDLNIVQERIKRLTGTTSKLVRFPGGSSNTVSRRYSPGIMSYLTEDLVNKGYKYYDWNISSGDAGETTNPDVVYSNVVNRLSHDRVNMVLMHDIKSYTRDALRRIIQYGKQNGYTFAAITENTKMVRQRVNN